MLRRGFRADRDHNPSNVWNKASAEQALMPNCWGDGQRKAAEIGFVSKIIASWCYKIGNSKG